MKLETWNDMALFCLTLTPEQLREPFMVDAVERAYLKNCGVGINPDDYLINVADNDDQGYREELKHSIEGDGGEFDESDYYIACNKDMPYLSADG